MATDDGDPVGWAWLSYPYDPHPVVYTTPLEPGARLCFVAQLRDPFDTPTGASSTACADMPDVPTEAADVGCGCTSTPSPAPDLLAPTGFLLLRRRRYQRLRTSLLDIA